MKRIITLILALVLCLSLVACGGASKEFTADVFIYTFADTYTASVRDSMQKQFDELGIKATFYDAANNQGTQTDQIQTVGIDGAVLLAEIIDLFVELVDLIGEIVDVILQAGDGQLVLAGIDQQRYDRNA